MKTENVIISVIGAGTAIGIVWLFLKPAEPFGEIPKVEISSVSWD